MLENKHFSFSCFPREEIEKKYEQGNALLNFFLKNFEGYGSSANLQGQNYFFIDIRDIT